MKAIPHLRHLSCKLSKLNENVTSFMLLGRDSGSLIVYKIYDPLLLREISVPVAYETSLGWVLVGLSSTENEQISVQRTCVNEDFTVAIKFPTGNIFRKLEDDNEAAFSIEHIKLFIDR